MDSNKLQEIRDKLNNMIENGSGATEILQVSVELDKLIEIYMEEKAIKNCK
jgi:hypothetical protein